MIPMAAPKANIVEIWKYRGKDMYIGKVQGKVNGGVVTFQGSDPLRPIIWLGGRSFTIYNGSSKKTVLYFDTLSGMLFRPREQGSGDDSIDMMAQASQNLLLGAEEAKKAEGIKEAQNNTGIVAIAGMILIFIMVALIFYLLATHSWNFSTPPTIVNGTANLVNSTSATHGLIGQGVVPLPNGTT